uniref:CSON013858 protein n=1 Tax=Culicoides sonorensis TaxID=179676 RepID=A0A336KTL0_CULSO
MSQNEQIKIEDNEAEDPLSSSINESTTNIPPTTANFICRTCQISFMTIQELSSHLKSHIKNRSAQEKLAECEICKCKVSEELFTEHFRTMHSEPKALRHECNTCHEIFTTKSSLANHIKSCDLTIIKLKCTKCEMVIRSYYTHLRNYHPLRCHICHREFSKERKLERHLEQTSCKLELKCNVCLIRYHDIKQLQSHIIENHFGGSEDTNETDEYNCSECKIFCGSLDMLNKHKIEHFYNNLNKTVASENNGSHEICKICKKNIPSKWIKTHMSGHKVEGFTIEEVIKIDNRLTCEICGEKFAERLAQMHQDSHFPRENCMICYRKFYPETLRKHERKCRYRAKLVCNICNKRFKTRHEMKSHEAKHKLKDKKATKIAENNKLSPVLMKKEENSEGIESVAPEEGSFPICKEEIEIFDTICDEILLNENETIIKEEKIEPKTEIHDEN